MLLSRVPITGVAVTVVSLLSPGISPAQTPPSGSFPPMPQHSGSRTVVSSSRNQPFAQNRNRTLLPLLEKVVWDPAQRGPLLIVAPEKTIPVGDRPRPLPVGRAFISTQSRLPDPDPSGHYRLSDLGDYFGRQVRVVGKSLTVFAPTTMTVLPTRLPRLDPYAGMGPNEKFRLFQSTLTPGQWATIGSAGGIGIGDLDSKQRDLFLSLLPEPFVVQPVRRGADGERIHYIDERPETGVTLTPAQRQGVRLSMHRVMDWLFLRSGSGEARGSTSLGVGGSRTEGEQYELRGNGFGSSFPGDRRGVFGVPLLEEAPNRLKPGQLPFSWSALDTPVSLDGAATVGELVKRAAAQTRVGLFCDPRYADLAVYVRSSGSRVRAGDLLEALCWAVTGTFRKVGADGGASFVMTDDVEGLGTRHARLQAWATANAALAEQRRNEVEDILAKAPIGENVGWSDSDGQRPDAALARKIEDFRKKVRDSGLPPVDRTGQRQEPALIVPVTELSAAAQETVRHQLESYAKSQESRKNDPFFADHPEMNAPLQPDRVEMDVKVQASFLVPGMGSVSAQGSGYSSDTEQSITRVTSRVRRAQQLAAAAARPAPPPAAIPAEYKQRALIIAPRTADEAAQAIAAAQAHGLNQVWIEVPPAGEKGTTVALAVAIAAGKKAKVAVGAVVRLLRVPQAALSEKAALPSDRNIVGESTTEYAARRAAVPSAAAPYFRPALTPAQEAERLRRMGDWLLPDAPAVQAAALKRAATIAGTPGLSGIVLRDVAAPGYDGSMVSAMNPGYSLDGGEQMGYTELMRQAFLHVSGIDPIDLSPLPQGRVGLPFSISYIAFSPDMQIPFFPDYGPVPGSYRINGQSAEEMGVRDGMARWMQFRSAKSDQMTESVVRAIRARQPDLPIWVQHGGDAFVGSYAFYDRGDGKAGDSGAQPAQRGVPAHSSQALLTVRCAPLADGKSATTDPAKVDFTQRLAGMMGHPQRGWNGVVVDLSEVPLDRALPLLDQLQTAPPSANR